MEKAKICSVENDMPQFTKGFDVMFNPNEIAIDEFCKNKYIENNRKKAQQKEDLVSLSLTLFYNTYDHMWQQEYVDVRSLITKFKPYQNQQLAKQKEYQEICFSWGSICIIGVLISFSIKYTMFTSDGTPVRAEVALKINGHYYGNESSFTTSKPDFSIESEHLNALLEGKESLRKMLLI